MINVVALTGRLVKDPEISRTNSGTSVCEFSIAVNRAFKQPGQPEADFPRIVCFNKTAESLCQYMQKGSLVGVTGRLQTSSYDGKDGIKHYKTTVVADRIDFLERKKDSQQQPAYQNQQPAYGDYRQGGYGGYQQQGYQQSYGGGYRQQPQYGYPEQPPAYSNKSADPDIEREDLPF